MTAVRVLVIDDEEPIRRFLSAALAAHGFDVRTAADLRAALVEVTARPPDVVVLDLGLPDGDGLDFVRQVRSWSTLPILILSARDREGQKVQALDAGADDYLTKPFSVPELLARLRVTQRHAAARAGATPDAPVLDLGDDVDGVRIDLGARVVLTRRAGQESEVKLTPNEFRLLAVLARHAGKVLTHALLLRECWGPGHEGDVAYLRVYMGQLRHKLEPEPARPRWLLTELGVGYRLRAE